MAVHVVRTQLLHGLDIGRGLHGGGIIHLDCGAVRILQRDGEYGELHLIGFMDGVFTGGGFVHLDCGAVIMQRDGGGFCYWEGELLVRCRVR